MASRPEPACGGTHGLPSVSRRPGEIVRNAEASVKRPSADHPKAGQGRPRKSSSTVDEAPPAETPKRRNAANDSRTPFLP